MAHSTVKNQAKQYEKKQKNIVKMAHENKNSLARNGNLVQTKK